MAPEDCARHTSVDLVGEMPKASARRQAYICDQLYLRLLDRTRQRRQPVVSFQNCERSRAAVSPKDRLEGLNSPLNR